MGASGPLFDGRAAAAVTALCRDAEQRIGDHGVNEVRRALDGVLQHPTGHYRSRIQTSNSSPVRISDGGVIYGPWLEGVGSRNRSTRFKGYATFRRTTGAIDRAAGPITETALRERYLARMN